MPDFPPEPCPFSLPLPGERLTWLLVLIGWDREELAWRLDIPTRTVAAWEKGGSFIPNRVAIWLEMLARTMAANAIPVDWDERSD